MLFTNSYKKIERLHYRFCIRYRTFIHHELFLVEIDWPAATAGWVTFLSERKYAHHYERIGSCGHAS